MADKQCLASSRYHSLETWRLAYLTRARDCSYLTIPHLVPPIGFTSTSILYTPYQSLGARGVSNLASKLLLTLLPPNDPFFRLAIDESLLDQIPPDQKSAVDSAMSKMEQAILKEMETRNLRVYLFEAAKHLIVSGNALLHMPRKGDPKVYPLQQFVCRRDCEGLVLEILVREKVSLDELPEEVANQIDDAELNEIQKKEGDLYQKEVEVYTWIRRGCRDDHENPDRYYVHQEVMGITVPGTSGEFPPDKLPWVPLRWTRITGEDYGRGYVEEYLGDVKSLEGLEQAIVEASAAASRILIFVNPASLTRPADVAEAPNGAVIPGKVDDVGVMSLEKFNDFRVASEEAKKIEDRLSFAFLLNSSIQRNAERVTAEEIRYMAGELESALGGIYSILSVELQLPLVKILMAQMQRAGKLPALPTGKISPTIITGVDALGRTQQQMRLDEALGAFAQIFGPEAVQTYVNPSEYMARTLASRGIDPNNLIRSEQEVQAQQQQAQNQQLAEKLGPHAIKAVSDNAQTNAQLQQQQQQSQAQATE